ncbi:MAG: zinc ABC transporter substrate-binding protein [Candidatus Riflebacteria bacterium]|nr:zinc ABC transporter substrate-binding protein [Candidatus Riflebacteria bacterium]
MNRSLLPVLLGGLAVTAVLGQPIKVAATNSDLAAITREIGKELVDVSLLLPPTVDPHSMPLRPSLIQKIREARLLITIGLDHEPWLPDAISSSGNARVNPGGPGYVDCSRGVSLAQIPTGPVDRSRGDLHIFGNTHYWLDPANVKIMAVHVTQALSGEIPGKREEIRSRARSFLTGLERRIGEWKTRLGPIAGKKVIAYHLTFPYLEAFTGIQVVDTIEMRPGIEPSPAHLAKLRDRMKQEKIRWIIMEPWYNKQRAVALASDVGAEVVVIRPSTPEGKTIGEHLDSLVAVLVKSMGR